MPRLHAYPVPTDPRIYELRMIVLDACSIATAEIWTPTSYYHAVNLILQLASRILVDK